MNSFQEKFKLLYIPYLVIVLVFSSAYTFLHWLLFQHWNLFAIRPDIVDYLLPLCLAWVPIILVYNGRAKLIRYGGRYKDGFIFQLLVWVAVAVPTIFVQFYLAKSIGTFTKWDYLLSQLGTGYVQTANELFALTFSTLVLGALAMLVLLFFVTIDQWELARYRAGLQSGSEHELNFLFSFFTPKGKYFFTPVFLNLNILVFLAMCTAGLGFKHFGTAALVRWGGNIRSLTSAGEWWRLLTCTFLHGGVTHLVSNMISLVFIGSLIEPVLGRWKFFLAYLLTGIFASLNSIWQHDATVSIGASGAIFGLYGVFVALLLAKVFPKDFRKQFLRMTLIFVIYNLAMGVSGNIDNAAHIGGLVSGIVIGLMFAPALKRADHFQRYRSAGQVVQ